MSRRTITVVAALLALVLVIGGAVAALSALSAGGDASNDETARVPDRPVISDQADGDATGAPDPGLASLYDQQLTWAACGSGNDCATLTVPLDYADPNGETIDLALLRVPARDQGTKVGQLVVNPGGPGAPGTTYAAAADRVFGPALLDHFDIVGFDPRGTGGSSPVDCLSDEQLDAFLAEDPDPDNDAEEQEFAANTDLIGVGCVERSGALASHVSTVEAARDMDVLRAALGRGKLDYFGASYGTKLGATYAQLFPEQVGHFVLDGAVDPTLTNLQLNLQQAGGFETALRAYVDNCVSGDSCFLGSQVDDGLATIVTLLDDIEEQPLSTGTDRELTVGLAFYGIIAPLYNRDYWVLLSQGLKAAINGDGSVLLQLADLYASRGPDGYTDNSAEANYAINCLDDPSAPEPDEVAGLLGQFEESSPTFGDVFAWSSTSCSGVQATASEPFPTITAEGAAPIVVVGTTRDPATPYAWSVALADQLASGVLVTRDGDGHTGYRSGNACVDGAVEDYLIDDVVPDDGLEC